MNGLTITEPTEYWKQTPETKDHWLVVADPDGWWKAVVRFDGCIHLDHAANSSFTNDPARKESLECDDYIHICDVDDFIARLLELKRLAKLHFGDSWE